MMSTIHSYLSLKVTQDTNDGLQKLIEAFDPDAKTKSNYIDVLICDEYSMVSDELVEFINKKIEKNLIGCVIMIGDPYQLPPVDNVKGMFTSDNIFMLNKIVRQAEGNPIIKTANRIKECIQTQNFELPIVEILKDLPHTYSRKEFFRNIFRR